MNSDGIYRDAKRQEGDSCFSIYQNNRKKRYFIFKETIQCKPFFLFLARALPVILDFPSYGSQSERAKMDIDCFGKYYPLDLC